MPQLSTIIDKFLRRVGLSAGEKSTLCDDLGAVKRSGDTLGGKLTGSGSLGAISEAVNTNLVGFEIIGGGGANAAMLTLHRPGVYAINFGLDTDNELAVGGWSAGAVRYRLWTEKHTVHESAWAPTFYAASWGNSSAAKQGDPFRPWGSYQNIYPPNAAYLITVHILDAGCWAYLNLNGTTQPNIEVVVTGAGNLIISAGDRKNLNLRVKASHCTSVQIYLATIEGPTLSTGSLEVHGANLNYVQAGVNMRLYNCFVYGSVIEARHVNEYSGSYGGYGSGGSYTYVAYNLQLMGCTVKDSTLYGNALTAYTSTFHGWGYNLASFTFNNCYP